MENKQQRKQINFTPIHSHPKWKSHIIPELQNLQQGKYSSEEIVQLLLIFNNKYCWRRRDQEEKRARKIIWYQALLLLYREELPGLCREFATALLQIKPQTIPMMMGQMKQQTRYHKQEIIYILLLMFFSLAPKQYSDGKQYLEGKFHNLNNFCHILSASRFKTACIVQYLKVNVRQLLHNKNNQIFTIIRNVQRKDFLGEVISKNKRIVLGKLTLNSNDRSIEEYNGQIKVDFANRFIGGGCLHDGCVQEEIMFAVRPQLYATTMLCQKMDDNEALAFIGFKRYFQYQGYGATTKFVGRADIKYKVTEEGQTEEFITAIDAIKFKVGGREQFEWQLIDRQLFKAYIGFSALSGTRAIVSGGWGCGVYNGDIQTKLIIQWIAATLASKQLVFCPFGKKKILQEKQLLEQLKGKNIEFIYNHLIRAAEQKQNAKYNKESLFSLISENLLSKSKI